MAKRPFGLGDGGRTLWNAIAPELDRGCVLIAAEFISDALEWMLRAKFEKEGLGAGDQDELLTDRYAPISDFSLRAKLGWAFGLIDPGLFSALEAIRRIRNLCAHQSRRSSAR